MATLSPTSAHSVSYFVRRAWALIGLVALAAVSLGGKDFAEAQATPGGDAGIIEPAAATRATYRIGGASTAAAPTPTYTVLGPNASVQLSKGADVTGDGQPDFVNPTGLAPRG